LTSLVLGAIRLYRRLVSPLLPPTCRYLPTCSQYACDAIEQHGLARGLALSAGRLLRCHPWGGHGHDPVPPARAKGPAVWSGRRG
jgi:putative membrane protein insertion efficiency factor